MSNNKRHPIDRLMVETRRLIFSMIEKLFARLPSHSDSELYVDDDQEISKEEFKTRFKDLLNIDVEDRDREEKPKRNFVTLEQFGLDLVAEARNGTFKAIVGRDEEVLLLIETLCRRTKRNPILVGPAGTGKTAIVEKFVTLLLKGRCRRFWLVPEYFQSSHLLC